LVKSEGRIATECDGQLFVVRGWLVVEGKLFLTLAMIRNHNGGKEIGVYTASFALIITHYALPKNCGKGKGMDLVACSLSSVHVRDQRQQWTLEPKLAFHPWCDVSLTDDTNITLSDR
jgi:hypothetical protein